MSASAALWLSLLAASAPPQEGEGRDFLWERFDYEVGALARPLDAAVAADGAIWVVEAGAHRVTRLTERGAERESLGGRGSGDGQLLDPSGLALAPDGRLFVTDTGNHRVAVWSSEGAFSSFGSRGRGPNELFRPTGIDVLGERLAVADTGNDRVLLFDLDGRLQRTIESGAPSLRGTASVGAIARPVDVVLGPAGRTWVLGAENTRVQEFDEDGRLVRSWGSWGAFPGQLDVPVGMAFFGGSLYVAERNNHRVQAFEPAGKPRGFWGRHAIRPRESGGRLHYPSGLALDPEGEFAVVCEGFENRVQVFVRGASLEAVGPSDPAFIRTGGSPHYGDRLDTSGDLMVLLEPISHAFLVFDWHEGEPVLIHKAGARGRKIGEFIDPTDAVLGEDPWRVTVVDRGNARLSVFALDWDAEGPLRYVPDLSRLAFALDLEEVVGGGVRWPIDPVAVERDTDGNAYVLDAANACVWVLDEEGALVRSFGSYGGGEGELSDPTDWCWDAAGEELSIVDRALRRVAVFDRSGKWIGARELALESPFGICRDGEDLIVTDAEGHSWSRLGADSTVASGAEGLGGGEFFRPRGVVRDARGRLVFLDWGNHRGQVLNPDGSFVHAFGSRLFVQPARRGRGVSPQGPVRND